MAEFAFRPPQGSQSDGQRQAFAPSSSSEAEAVEAEAGGAAEPQTLLQALEHLSALLGADMDCSQGYATDGREFARFADMWREELSFSADGRSVDDAMWYAHGMAYWELEENCSADDNGVLGGYGELSPADVEDSTSLLRELRASRPQWGRKSAADFGGGIGRVVKAVLLPHFERVTLVEQSPRLIWSTPRYLNDEALAQRVELVNQGLQFHRPAAGTHDLIWMQWVIGHIHDLDLIQLLRRCAAALRPHGVIVIKDNAPSPPVPFILDKDDNTVVRCPAYVRRLVKMAGLSVVMTKDQTRFPDDLYDVFMLVLAPAGDDARDVLEDAEDILKVTEGEEDTEEVDEHNAAEEKRIESVDVQHDT